MVAEEPSERFEMYVERNTKSFLKKRNASCLDMANLVFSFGFKIAFQMPLDGYKQFSGKQGSFLAHRSSC